VVNIAVIGCGTIADEEHLPAFTSMGDVCVTAVADIDPQRLDLIADRFAVKARYEEYRAMLRRERIDAVCICTPNHLHAPMTVDCCRAGKHVLVEKPAATSMAEISRMKAAAEKAGVILMVEQTQRFQPVNEKARQVIQSGTLGGVTGFRATVRSGGPSYWAPDSKWFFNKAEAFGGALADTGIHIIDTIRWITGKEIARVSGFAANLHGKGDVEDSAVITLETTDGRLGMIEAAWNNRPNFLTYQVYCEKGRIETVNYKGLQAALREPQAEMTIDVPGSSATGGPFRYFIDCVKTGTKPFVDIEEGGRSLAVVIAGYRSAATGKAVKVPFSGRA